ncbi:MAG: hypothetical protein UDK34_01965 [Cyanobacteriota bacterium]|nr:hypothetical protein [Cyanobacteriota bacterium]
MVDEITIIGYLEVLENYYRTTDKEKADKYHKLISKYYELRHSNGLYYEGKEQDIKKIELEVLQEYEKLPKSNNDSRKVQNKSNKINKNIGTILALFIALISIATFFDLSKTIKYILAAVTLIFAVIIAFIDIKSNKQHDEEIKRINKNWVKP